MLPSWIRSRKLRPSISIALGDRDDEAEVVIAQLLPGRFVPPLTLDDQREPAAKRCGSFACLADQGPQLLADFGPATSFGVAATSQLGPFAVQGFHAPQHLVQPLQCGIQELKLRPHLLNEVEHLRTASDDLPPRLAALLFEQATVDGQGEILVIARQKLLQGVQTAAQELPHAVLLIHVVHRHLDSIVQPDLTIAKGFQELDRRLQQVIGGQHATSIPGAAPLDAARQRDLRFPAQKRNGVNLRQVGFDCVRSLFVHHGRSHH